MRIGTHITLPGDFDARRSRNQKVADRAKFSGVSFVIVRGYHVKCDAILSMNVEWLHRFS